jgi:hypothetical protein
MKKLFVAALSISVCLFGADFWQSKPFTDWNEKDTQKMVENSPWSKSVSVAIGSLEGPRANGSGRGSMGEANVPPSPGGAGSGEDAMGGGGGGGGGKRNRGGENGVSGPIESTTLIVRWQTALPVKQALAKMKYGSEVTTSEEARKILATENAAYVIAITGVGPGMIHAEPEALKKDLMERSALTVKGKDDLKPSDVQLGKAGRGFELYFVFPKKTQFSLDDKEIEFTTKLGAIGIRQRFRVKDMVYNGKLAL